MTAVAGVIQYPEMKLGKLLQAYRFQEKISVRQMAKELGVDHTSLWRFEQGQIPKHKFFVAILKWALLND